MSIIKTGSTSKNCTKSNLVWTLLHRSKKLESFDADEHRIHRLAHQEPFNCFRLTFERDSHLPDFENSVKVRDLFLAHSIGEPSVEQICGKPTYEQDILNDVSAPRVVGGNNCRKGACPWQAALLDEKTNQFCGGSVISDRHILTAAHCLQVEFLFFNSTIYIVTYYLVHNLWGGFRVIVLGWSFSHMA